MCWEDEWQGGELVQGSMGCYMLGGKTKGQNIRVCEGRGIQVGGKDRWAVGREMREGREIKSGGC